MHNRTPYLLFYVQREAESKIKLNYSLDTTDESDYYDLINTYSCDVNDEIIDKINLLPRDTTMISIVDFNEKNNLTSSEDINGVFEDLMDYSSVSGSFSASIDSVTKKRKPKKQSLRNRNLKIKLQKQEARKDPIKYQFWYSINWRIILPAETVSLSWNLQQCLGNSFRFLADRFNSPVVSACCSNFSMDRVRQEEFWKPVEAETMIPPPTFNILKNISQHNVFAKTL